MKRSLTTLATLLTLSAAAWTQGLPDLKLTQFDWDDASGSVTTNTRMGALEFHFSADDTAFLRANGGRFINVVLYNNVTQGVEWIVQNLYVAYPDANKMVGDDPDVSFGVGLTSATGTAWTLSILGYSFTDAPLASPVYTYVQWQMPEHHVYSKGARATSGILPPAPLYASIGAFKAYQGGDEPVFKFANIGVPASKIPEINEWPGECAPAAVARSIAYLADGNGSSTPQTPQDTSETLAVYMDTNVNQFGTVDPDLLDGKLDYCDDYELPICTSLVYGWNDNIGWIMDRLSAGCDVEVLFAKHVAMLTGVTQGPGGVTLISTVDDPDQTDDTAENQSHINVVLPGGGCPGMGSVDGFLVECWGMCNGGGGGGSDY